MRMDVFVDLRIGFGEMETLGKEKVIKMGCQMIGLVDEVEMEIVAVGEEISPVPFGTKGVDEIQAPGRKVLKHGHPCVNNSLRSGARPAILKDFRHKIIG